ncbi:MAG: hypothetical protein Q7T40_05965 [Methylobacter sp.]|nr:hypothetical protein [Methylobacter sp.]
MKIKYNRRPAGRLYDDEEGNTLSQFLSICNTIGGFTTVCFDHPMFLPADYKNKAIAALADDITC